MCLLLGSSYNLVFCVRSLFSSSISKSRKIVFNKILMKLTVNDLKKVIGVTGHELRRGTLAAHYAMATPATLIVSPRNSHHQLQRLTRVPSWEFHGRLAQVGKQIKTRSPQRNRVRTRNICKATAKVGREGGAEISSAKLSNRVN